MFTLRPYQQEASGSGLEFLTSASKKKNGVCVIPTGGGKSLVIADIVSQLDAPTIVFQPSKELLEQNYAKFLSYGSSASVFSASKNSKKVGAVTYATIGSVVKHSHLFRDFKYCIIDECHLVSPQGDRMYQRFFEATGLNNLGFTATPIRLKNYSGMSGERFSQLNMLNRMRPKAYHDYIHVTQVADLAYQGFFAPLNYRVNTEFRKDLLKTNSTGAEYSDKSIDRAYAMSQINPITINFIKRTDRKHVLIFMRSIADAEIVSKATGTPLITGKTAKKERESLLAGFKKGRYKAMLNVGVLTTGFDFPELDCVVLARPTLSLALYYQMIGRGVRPHPDKADCMVVDMVNNYAKFGRVEELQVLEKAGGWGMYSRGQLLTGVPMYG